MLFRSAGGDKMNLLTLGGSVRRCRPPSPPPLDGRRAIVLGARRLLSPVLSHAGSETVK